MEARLSFGDKHEIIYTYAADGRKLRAEYRINNFAVVDRIIAEAEVKYGIVERIFNDSEVSRKAILDDRQLSAALVEQTLPLEQETVLVGYYDGPVFVTFWGRNFLSLKISA